MGRISQQRKEDWAVAGVGLLIFAALNVLMLHTNFERWTNAKLGFWSAFHKGFDFSGFDQHAYIIVSKWRPLYTHLRHPMLNTFEWPLAQLNAWLMDALDMNCAILIVAVVWTLVATASWVLLYKLLRRIMGLGLWLSLMLCMFHYSLAYVMLATFVPDHMILSTTLLLLTIYIAAKARQQGKGMRIWKSLILFFLATGVTTTNAVKVWLIDMTGIITQMREKGKGMALMAAAVTRRSLLYIVPLMILAGLYIYQEETSIAEERESARRQTEQHMQKDSVFRAKMKARSELHKRVTASNQIAEGKLFEYTNNDVNRWLTLRDNIFGEGIQLHEDYLLKDANLEKRPVFVSYRHWWNDAVEVAVVLLFLFGLWCGRRHWLSWMVFLPFMLDMLLHVGLSFALYDVYIMTAHWAYIMPIAYGFLIKNSQSVAYGGSALLWRPWHHRLLVALIAAITLWLWWHNLHLIVGHILK